MQSLPRAAALSLALLLPTAALACPQVELSGAALNFTSDQAYVPQAVPVVAGGNVDLGACGTVPGLGWVATSPDFELSFSGNGMGRALEFRVEAGCDATLLVNDANGNWHFNDDDANANPRIRLEGASEGLYDIWIGTFEPSTCDAVLIVETF